MMAKNKAEPEIEVRVIIELLGTPKEHIESSINLLIESISNKHKVISQEVREPVQQSEKFYSAFAEMSILFPSLAEIIGFILDYHPSSIEIIEPETIFDSAQNLTALLNDLISKIHRMDMQIKTLLAKNKLLEKERK